MYTADGQLEKRLITSPMYPTDNRGNAAGRVWQCGGKKAKAYARSLYAKQALKSLGGLQHWFDFV